MSKRSTPSDTLGYCRRCGVEVHTDSFRDLQSLHEYRIAASCQRCQDLFYLGTCDSDPPASHPLRNGVVVAPLAPDGVLREIALLPFLFVVPPRRLVWEPRYIVRAGPELLPVDPWVELESLHRDWDGYNVRVLCVRSVADPTVHRKLAGRDLVIGLDEPSVRIAAQLCRDIPPAALVSLGDAVPWRDAYGTPLEPLAPFLHATALEVVVGCADRCDSSALRQCALIARLLALPAESGPDAGRPAFEILLRAHAGRFGESSRGRSGDAS